MKTLASLAFRSLCLAFVAAGCFTGTQKPRKRDSHANDGAGCGLDDD